MKRKNNVRLLGLIIVLITLFVIFLVLHKKAHSYQMEYTIDDIKIVEKYDNNSKYYTFNIKYKDIDTNIISIDKYTNSRQLIKDINIKEDNGNICLLFSSDLELYPICHNSDGYYSYYIDKQDEFITNDIFNNINIKDLNNKSFLLWNYHGFIYLNNKTKKNMDLFNKDTYTMNLIYQYDNNLIIPDYNQDWIFNKIYIINTNNGKVSDYQLRFPVYFDSYFMGNDKDNVYIYDKKEEQEYYLDIKNKEIYKTNNKVLNNNKWETLSTQKLKTEEIKFNNDLVMNYYIKNDNLYVSNDLRVSNRIIDTIVGINSLDVYYLSDGILYMFNPNYGEKALLQYSEWEFNNKNMVFVF